MRQIIRLINNQIRAQLRLDQLSRPEMLLIFFVAFLLGIFLESLLVAAELLKVLFVLMLVLILFWPRLKNQIGAKKLLALLLLAVVLGGLRFYFSLQLPKNDVSRYSGKVTLQACIVDEVDVRQDQVKYTVEAQKLENIDGFLDVSGRVLITANKYPLYLYGDCFVIIGKLQKPDKINNFNYAEYLSRYGIHAVIYQAKIAGLDDGVSSSTWTFLSWIYGFKKVFEAKLSSIYGEPYSGFMAGLLLGSRRGISAELTQKFNITGLSHIVAVSGYNITMLIVVVSGLLGFLTRRKKVVVSICFIVLFVILVGVGASVVRAAIMGIIGLFALWFGRSYFVKISLFSAAFFMNLWNPQIMLYDVGFQLSFLATCGLVYVSPILEKYFTKVPEVFGMREAMMMTVSAQILALPIILMNFGRLSLIAPFSNVFVLPFVPLAMFFGFFAVLFSYIWNFLGLLVGFFGYFVMALMILLVNLFAAIPLASLDVSWCSWWLSALYYFGILLWIMANNRS